MKSSQQINVLDHGYVKLVERWGTDATIIEAARMSTGKGFLGWGPKYICGACKVEIPNQPDPAYKGGHTVPGGWCDGEFKAVPGDEKLLSYLYNHKHMTPFEMCGMTIEVKAPIFVFREWHRHRTQSYNEMSARYIPLPNENYMPNIDNLIDRALAAALSTNRQSSAADAKGNAVDEDDFSQWLRELANSYRYTQQVYEQGLALGVPKELARLSVPVARYSCMRASANLRNWLAFLTLRTDAGAQWEIRQYAQTVASIINDYFPRTYELFTLGHGHG